MSYNLLKGKKGIIFGALNEQSIAWRVAERAVEEGAEIILTNTAMAARMGQLNELGEKLGAKVVLADATKEEELEVLFQEAINTFGKVDFVLHSIGMSPNVRKGRSYDDLDYKMLQTTFDVSAVSFHKMLQVAKKYAGKIDVYKIDIDKEAGLANIFGVKSIPMCLFIPMQGTPIQTVGDLTPDQIEETIKQIYSDAK